MVIRADDRVELSVLRIVRPNSLAVRELLESVKHGNTVAYAMRQPTKLYNTQVRGRGFVCHAPIRLVLFARNRGM